MINLGFHHNGRPSARRLADEAGVAVGAALRVIHRENYGEDSVLAVGRAMRDEQFVADWVGLDAGQEYRPPAASRRLTGRQRVLIDELINELAQGGQQWATGTPGPEDDADDGGVVRPFPDPRYDPGMHQAQAADELPERLKAERGDQSDDPDGLH